MANIKVVENILLKVLAGLIPSIQAVAKGFEADTAHPNKVAIGTLIDTGLAFLQAALDGLKNKPIVVPTVPDSLNAPAPTT